MGGGDIEGPNVTPINARTIGGWAIDLETIPRLRPLLDHYTLRWSDSLYSILEPWISSERKLCLVLKPPIRSTIPSLILSLQTTPVTALPYYYTQGYYLPILPTRLGITLRNLPLHINISPNSYPIQQIELLVIFRLVLFNWTPVVWLAGHLCSHKFLVWLALYSGPWTELDVKR